METQNKQKSLVELKRIFSSLNSDSIKEIVIQSSHLFFYKEQMNLNYYQEYNQPISGTQEYFTY
jgi:hypothetical protein